MGISLTSMSGSESLIDSIFNVVADTNDLERDDPFADFKFEIRHGPARSETYLSITALWENGTQTISSLHLKLVSGKLIYVPDKGTTKITMWVILHLSFEQSVSVRLLLNLATCTY
jgi:hypothetical protein